MYLHASLVTPNISAHRKRVDGKFLGPGGTVPTSQAVCSSLLEECFDIVQEIRAKDESKNVASSLKPIYDRLSEIRKELEQLVGIVHFPFNNLCGTILLWRLTYGVPPRYSHIDGAFARRTYGTIVLACKRSTRCAWMASSWIRKGTGQRDNMCVAFDILCL